MLDARRCNAIVTASERVRRGELDAHFVVDALQGGAGTSSNMNANEVIANVALLSLGHVPGRYEALHPNDHVNASQSTNDVYPSALRLALHAALQPLLHEAQALQKALRAQAARHAGVMKIGRTQLQDAVPMTVGQEFGAWAATVAGDTAALQRAALGLHTLNLGGTAVGTGVNAPPGFGRLAIDQLARLLGRPLQQADDLVHAGQDTASLLDLSAALRCVAVHLGKIASDLRLLGSGPQAGFGDLRLPPRQAGSSIMPGKVNPVIPEAVNQVAFAVIGGDVTVALACEAGQLQLNAFEPLGGDWRVSLATQREKYRTSITSAGVAQGRAEKNLTALGVGYDFGFMRVAAFVNDDEFVAVNGTKEKAREWAAGVTVPVGAFSIDAMLAEGKIKGVAQKTSGFGLVLRYDLSKRTDLYAGHRSNRDDNSPTTGATVRTARVKDTLTGVGIRHRF